MKKTIYLILGATLLALMGCQNQNKEEKFEFKNWNQCESLTSLKSFVEKSLDKADKKNYIPSEDRIAVFDMDGTLYGELFPTYLEYVMYQYRVLEDPTYKDLASEEEITFANEIKEGVHNNSYPSGTDMRHARLAAKAYSGMTLKAFDEYAKTFLKKSIPCFSNMTYAEAFYEPMREVVNYLKQSDYEVYVVSGSDRFLCRSLLIDNLGISSNNIIGMDVKLVATNQGDTEGVNYQITDEDQILRSDELLIKNLKFNKVAQIIKEIGKQPVLSFGNSGGDQSMHKYTINNNQYPAEAFMLVADDTVRDYSYLTDEKIASLNTQWSNQGFHVVSMKNDFKTIYKANVSKAAVA